jgi:membrane dipeptidase
MPHRIFDTHCDAVIRVVNEHADLALRSDAGHIDVPRLLAGGVGCQVFACFVQRGSPDDDPAARADRMMDAVADLARIPEVVIPRTFEQLAALRDDAGHVGVLLAVEGGDALAGKVSRVDELRERGVRYITLAWADNDLTGSAFGKGGGLTGLGKDVVRRMNARGVLVDVSHMSDAAFADLSRATDRPFIASHSNCRALCDSPRNLTDDQVREVAARGGAIGVMLAPGFLSEDYRRAEAPVMARYLPRLGAHPDRVAEIMAEAQAEMVGVKRPASDVVFRHIEHIVEVGGIACAALGSDFDGIPATPTDLPDCSEYQVVARLLEAHGCSGDEIEAVCWSNWERVFRQTFDV